MRTKRVMGRDMEVGTTFIDVVEVTTVDGRVLGSTPTLVTVESIKEVDVVTLEMWVAYDYGKELSGTKPMTIGKYDHYTVL